MFGHLSQFPARVTADLRLQAYRYRVASRGPARRGTHLRASGVSADVFGVELAPDASIEVRLRLGLIQRSTGPLPTLALANTDRRLAVLYPLRVGRGPFRPALEMYGGAFVMAGLSVQFRSGEFGPRGRWKPGVRRREHRSGIPQRRGAGAARAGVSRELHQAGGGRGLPPPAGAASELHCASAVGEVGRKMGGPDKPRAAPTSQGHVLLLGVERTRSRSRRATRRPRASSGRGPA